MNNIRMYLGGKGFPCFRCNVGTVKTADGRFFTSGLPEGFPDLMALLPHGRVLFIECKTRTGRMREAQIDFKNLCEKMGHTYIVARSVDDVEPFLC